MRSIWAAAAWLIAAACIHAQTLSPREVFYGEGRADSTKKPASGAKKAPAVPKPAASSKPPLEEASRDAGPAVNETVQAPARPQYVSVRTETARPLGLRYSILKRGQAGEYVEVDSDSTFVSGDHIKLVIESNDSAYLYVVNQGTSQVWKVLYPSQQVENGSNRVQRGRQYSIPNEAVFSFNGQVGTEKLFIILSRQPERDLEKLMYSLSDKQPKESEPPRALLAESIAPVQDSLIERLRTSYSRDLVIEKVDDSKAPPAAEPKRHESSSAPLQLGEKAVYVVNPNAGENARVVADVKLRHE